MTIGNFNYHYDYGQTMIMKMFLATADYTTNTSNVYINLDQALELIKKTDAITQGVPKIVYLVGWQYLGHDSGYPELFEVNPFLKRPQDATARDSLLWLMAEAKKYNTVVSVHINFMDHYKESPSFQRFCDADAVICNPDGTPRCVEVLSNRDSYKISAKHFWESGLFKEYCDRFLDYLPIEETHTVHVDAWHVLNQYSPYTSIREQQDARQKMWEYLESRGVDVTIETNSRELDDRIDYLVGPYCRGMLDKYKPEELVPGRWKECPICNLGHIPYVWWLDCLTDEEWVDIGTGSRYTGYPTQEMYRRIMYGPIHGENVWMDQYMAQPRPADLEAWTHQMLREFCTMQLPCFYVNRYKRLRMETDATKEEAYSKTLYLSEGVICRGEDASIEKNGLVLKRENDLLLPVGNVPDTFIAYSEKGRDGSWNIPDASFEDATLYELKGAEKRKMGVARIEGGKIMLAVKPGQAILICKE